MVARPVLGRGLRSPRRAFRDVRFVRGNTDRLVVETRSDEHGRTGARSAERLGDARARVDRVVAADGRARDRGRRPHALLPRDPHRGRADLHADHAGRGRHRPDRRRRRRSRRVRSHARAVRPACCRAACASSTPAASGCRTRGAAARSGRSSAQTSTFRRHRVRRGGGGRGDSRDRFDRADDDLVERAARSARSRRGERVLRERAHRAAWRVATSARRGGAVSGGAVSGSGRSSSVSRPSTPTPRSRSASATDLELLVSVMLSAQTTDTNVNRVTSALFLKYRKPEDYLAVPQEELERDIYATGFYPTEDEGDPRHDARPARGVRRQGADAPRGSAEAARASHARRPTSSPPSSGMRRGSSSTRTCRRLAQRLGLTRNDDPVKIERDLQKVVPREELGTSAAPADLARAACLRRTEPSLRDLRRRGSLSFVAPGDARAQIQRRQRKSTSWTIVERDDETRRHADRPVLVGEHPLEVLPVEPDDQRGDEHERRDHGQLLPDLVLRLGDLGLEVVARACEQVAGDVELLGCPDERVVGIAEESLDLWWKQRVVTDLDPPVEHPAHCCPCRRHHAATVQQLVADLRKPEPHARRSQLVDVILEVVELGVDGVEQIEIRVGDVVDTAGGTSTPTGAAFSCEGCRAAISNAVPPGAVFLTVTRRSGVATRSISHGSTPPSDRGRTATRTPKTYDP